MATPAEAAPTVAMLGQGWFPASIGGLDRYFGSLLEQLPEASAVVVGPAPGAPPRVQVAATGDAALARRLLAYRRAARRAAGGADLIDAHFALYAASAVFARGLRTRPLAFHFHGPWADESVAGGDSSRVKLALRRALERRVLGRAAAIIVLSGAFRTVLVERYAISPWCVHVISPGVELKRFTPGDRPSARGRLALGESAFVVACVRRLVPRVGVARLLNAWGLLAGSLPPGSTLLVAGDGPLRARLESLAGDLGVGGSVRFMGRVSDAELLDVYRAADVAAVPTSAHEGFGMVVLEAAACGTPSVVSAVGGLPEAIAPLDPSLVVTGTEPGAWAARLRAAAAGSLPAREATRRYAERFDWTAVAARHRRLYWQVLRGGSDDRLRVAYVCEPADADTLASVLTELDGVLVAHILLAQDDAVAQRLHAAGLSLEILRTGRHPIALARRLRRLRPDLVHVRPSATDFGLRAAGIARLPTLRETPARRLRFPTVGSRQAIVGGDLLGDDPQVAARELVAAYRSLLGLASSAAR